MCVTYSACCMKPLNDILMLIVQQNTRQSWKISKVPLLLSTVIYKKQNHTMLCTSNDLSIPKYAYSLSLNLHNKWPPSHLMSYTDIIHYQSSHTVFNCAGDHHLKTQMFLNITAIEESLKTGDRGAWEQG